MTAAEAPRWRRLEPDARRSQILECAVRLFGERPYSAVSTADIARAAGVARGLLNHYFGTKRELYLEVVRRLVMVPADGRRFPVPAGSLAGRVDAAVDWFLDAVSLHGATFVAVISPEGVGADPEVEQILTEADDAAALALLDALGLDPRSRPAAYIPMMRAYGGMAKATVREWLDRGTLSRAQAHTLLSHALVTIVDDVLAQLEE